MDKMRRDFIWRPFLHVAALAVSMAGTALATGAAEVDFNREILPILSENCFACHGPDDKDRKGKLQLDIEADAKKARSDGTFAIKAGNADESSIIQRILSSDPDEVMPPPDSHKTLTANQKEKLKEWINKGAVYETHWAFKAVRRPNVPKSANSKLSSPIDQFVQARLEKEGLGLSSEASKTTLVRRLYLDLIGLPPTPAEVDRFLADKSPQAYENLVDELLKSPHYGEHMGRWWLDLARYADSNGYQVDLTRSIWPYRDYVINAFNRNMPFDQFSIEQLAGDLLPNPTLEQKVATGFNRNTKINDEGGGDAEEYRTKAVKDRVATTATTWLGLTMACAECHTHKYDPITHEEYYKFYSFFNNSSDGGNYSVEPTIQVPPPDLSNRTKFIHDQQRDVLKEIAQIEAKLPAEQAEWEKKVAQKFDPWTKLTLERVISTGGASFTNLPDKSVLATGVNPIYENYSFEAKSPLRKISAVLLEVLPDPSLPKNGPGRWGQTGNFILDEFIANVEVDGKSVPLNFASATAEWEQEHYTASQAVDTNPKSGWAIGPRFGKSNFLLLKLAKPMDVPADATLKFKMEHNHGNSHSIGRWRVSVTDSDTSHPSLWPIPSDLQQVLAKEASGRSDQDRKNLSSYFRANHPAIRAAEKELFLLNQRESELVSMKFSTLVMKELDKPRNTYIHLRGNFLDKGPDTTPGVPAFLPNLSTDGPTNRLALARWLVSKENPLTARVLVNNIWSRFFGTGIVQTSEDFGLQGEKPSHPELLDYLASEMVDSGWYIKKMVRSIVLSATYKQSSAANETLLEKDPYNRLLSRGPRFRMDAEMIRDNALAVSGLLNRQVGGPSVYPQQIEFLWKEIGFLRPEIGMDVWPTSVGPDLYRRGVYTFWRRVATYPSFATFDAPSREICTARRPRTNTPLQALAALNDPVLMEAARGFAKRILQEGGASLDQQLQFAFKTTLGREASSAEMAKAKSYLEKQITAFGSEPESVRKLLQTDAVKPAEKHSPQQLAAWTMLANALLNLDETITKG